MKKISILLLLVCILTATISFTGCKSKNELFEYGLKIDNACSISKVKNKEITSVEIPSSHDGRQVKYIDRSAFEGCNKLTSIIIPEGIEFIDKYAFKGCTSLKNVSLPNSIKEIDYDAFEDCESLEFNIYENGQYLGNKENSYVMLFSGINKEVSSFEVNENCTIIYQEALSNFTNLTTIDMPYSIRYIGSYAFRSCQSLKSFVVPNFIELFDASWFYYCTNLQSITLSANVNQVSIGYMDGCNSFSEFRVYSTNPKFSAKDGVLYSKDLKTLLAYPRAKSGKNFTIPTHVETVATYAFNGCIYLRALTMWGTIKTLRSGSLINCYVFSVYYKGTMNEWVILDNANPGWDHSFDVVKVFCSNGLISRSKT